jgi:hypothetical protein
LEQAISFSVHRLYGNTGKRNRDTEPRVSKRALRFSCSFTRLLLAGSLGGDSMWSHAGIVQTRKSITCRESRSFARGVSGQPLLPNALEPMEGRRFRELRANGIRSSLYGLVALGAPLRLGFPGGFPLWYRQYRGNGSRVTTRFLVLINAGLLVTLLEIALVTRRPGGTRLERLSAWLGRLALPSVFAGNDLPGCWFTFRWRSMGTYLFWLFVYHRQKPSTR